MNIGIYTEAFKPYLGGVSVSVDIFATSLARQGHRVHVFAPSYPQQNDFNNNPFVFRFWSIGTKLYNGYRIALPFSFRHNRYVKNSKLEIVHTQHPFILGWKACWIARKQKIPLVYTFHTLFTEYVHFIPYIPKVISVFFVKRLVQLFCNCCCDYIITPTEYAKLMLQKDYGVRKPVAVVPTGVESALVDAASGKGIREKFEIAADTFLLLYVGRLSQEKNILFLLRVMKIISKLSENVRLMIVARGPQEHVLKEYVQKNCLETQVIFVGEVQRAEIYNYYKVADLFVYASKTETQGLVLSEAKACALPALAIEAAGVSEMINDGLDGYLVKESEEMFVQRVLELKNKQELLHSFSQAARKSAEENFLDTIVVDKLLGVYKKALDLKRANNG